MFRKATRDLLAAALPLILGLGVLPSAYAVNIGYSAGYTGTYSTNTRNVAGEGPDDLINNFNVGFDLEQQGSGLSAEIDSLFNFQQYTKDTIDDVLRGNLDAEAIWFVRPGSFEWHITDVFGSTAISDLQSGNPSNEQNTNAFSTGPRFFFRVGARNKLQLDFRYENYAFERSGLDSDRVGGLFSWGRPLSETAEISFNIAGSMLTYSQEAADDIDRIDVYWQGDFERSAGQLTLAIGGSKIQSEGPDDPSGITGRIDWTRQLGGNSTLSANVSSEFTDTAAALLEGLFDRPDIGSVQINSETFRRSNAELSYSRDTAQNAVTLLVFGTDIDFESGNTDRRIFGATGVYRRPVSARTTINFGLRYGNTDFDILNREDKDWRANMGVSYLLRQTLTLDVGGSWSDRDSTDPLFSYKEIRGEVGITYSVPLR